MKNNYLKLTFYVFLLSFLFYKNSLALEDYIPEIPKNFSEITWVKSPGINSYFKEPKNNGSIDYITKIYLPKNEINFIISKEPENLGLTGINKNTDTPPFGDEIIPPEKNINNLNNLSFERITSEQAKKIDSSIKFIWNAQFFNMKQGSSDLSMAIKYSNNNKTVITSGSRSVFDIEEKRRMLIIDNKKGFAEIKDFNSIDFIDKGDQALEGFYPTTEKGSGATSRLFLGVSKDGKELIIYCSKLATIKDASNSLLLAGVPLENQLQTDGGGSAFCGYNLPGQHFVESTRALPIFMGAKTIFKRGIVATEKLNIRDSSSIKSKIVGKLKKEELIKVFEEKDGWYKIGDNMWVSKLYIK